MLEMIKNKLFKPFTLVIFLFISILFSINFSFPDNALGSVYYVSPFGQDNNDGLSTSKPWATFTRAMAQLAAGDTLYLMDGTYFQSLNVTVSGKNANPIIIKALNDGKAKIDGKNIMVPLRIAGSSANHKAYINVEGIVCQNSSEDVIKISYSDNINIKRVSAYNANSKGNYVVFSIFYNCNNVLIEDCVASGTGRKMFMAFADSSVTFRRCWGRWTGHEWGNWRNCLNIYGADDCIVENCIVTMDSTVTKAVSGIGIGSNNNPDADRNKICGNIVYGVNQLNYYVSSNGGHQINDNEHINNVAIVQKTSANGFTLNADGNWKGDKLTLVGIPDVSLFSVQVSNSEPDNDFAINGDLRNSVLFTGETGIYVSSSPLIKSFTNKYNNVSVSTVSTPYSGSVSQGNGEAAIQGIIPSYDTSKYGKGAYLIRPENLKGKGDAGTDIGAEVLYQYINGVLHQDDQHRLWPWPMEDRIFTETGVSATWENNGGLWKTLDGVYGIPQNQPLKAPTGFKSQIVTK